MATQCTRRRFFKNAALSGAGLVLLKDSRSARGFAANEKVNVALVGVSGRGSWFSDTMPSISNVVAMCDVNERRAAPYFKAIPDAKKYSDFRKMLEEMDKQIDAVVVATPDNTHAVISALAIRMGKGVYCEKPLTHDVYESRFLRDLAAEKKVATQLGNQGTATEPFRRAVELIWGGVLGDVQEVHVWNTNGGSGERPLPTEEHPVPDYLNWDLWLGPARWRPYNSRWVEWSTWRDFATGQLGNWASHTMNLVFKGLKIDSLWNRPYTSTGWPAFRVDVELSGVHRATFPEWEIIRYHIPSRGDMKPVTVNWYNGAGKAPQCREHVEEMLGHRLDWGDTGEKKWADHAGCVIAGTKGMIHSTGHNATFKLLPSDKFKDFQGPAPTLPRSPVTSGSGSTRSKAARRRCRTSTTAGRWRNSSCSATSRHWSASPSSTTRSRRRS